MKCRSVLHAFALPILALVFQGPAAHPQSPVDPAFAALLQQKLDSCVTAFSVPGISVSLLLPGDRYWHGAAGEANIETSAPMDTAYLFQMASVTKLYTAAIIFQLIDEGLLELNDPISEFLPEMPNIPQDMQIKYLLNHRSGIADHLVDGNAMQDCFTDPDSVFSPLDIMSSFVPEPLFPANAAFSYSNSNYVLLGMVIEAITGEPLSDVLRDRITEPLGLDLTFLPPNDELQGSLVPGWTSFTQLNVYDTDATPFFTDCFAGMAYAAGAIVAQPSDVSLFTRELFAGDLVSSSSMNSMLTFTNVNFSDGCNGYGHGVMRYPIAGNIFYGHGGDISGFTQLSVHEVTDSITLTVSINRNNAPRVPIANELLELVYAQSSVGMSEPIATNFEIYPNPASGKVFIRSNDLPDRIEIYDITGRMLRSIEDRSNMIAIDDLAAGTYSIRVVIGSVIQVQKLIVQR